MNDLIFPNEYYYDEVREGFFIPEMTKRFWAAQLEVLREIDRICKRHGLTWFANYGTLLGAVRHKGYIPWDDDLDITILRDDYDIFFEAAKGELPQGYVIMSCEEQDDYAYPFGRITNEHSINWNPEHLKKFHGCPYVVGVDIYPYDKIFPDNTVESDRVRRGKEIFTALKMLNTSGLDKRYLEDQIKKIEHLTGTAIDRKKHLGNQLSLILEKICAEARNEDAKECYLLYSWILYGTTKFPVEYFKEYSELPFETTSIPIPVHYDDILRAFYSDYMKPVRTGGAHEYPVYKRQELIFRAEKGENPYRYTLTSDMVSKKRIIPRVKDNCTGILNLLKTLHSHISQIAYSKNDLVSVLQSCQNSAVSLATMLEGRFGTAATDAVMILEVYCEAIYNLSIEMNEEKVFELNSIISSEENELNKLFALPGKVILFLPCRIAWWDTMRPVFEGAVSDKRNTVSVIPIPHFDCDFLGNIGTVHDNAKDFAEISELSGYLTTFERYGIEKIHPDIIVIQVPFDGFSCSLTVPEILYSDNLLKFTDELIYVPCFDTLIPDTDKDPLMATLEVLIEQPAVVNADRIILKHKRIKEIYLKTLVSLTSQELEPYWREKICLLSEVDWCNGS